MRQEAKKPHYFMKGGTWSLGFPAFYPYKYDDIVALYAGLYRLNRGLG